MSQGRFFRQIIALRSRFSSAPELPFSEVLTEERIEAAMPANVVYRERLFPPCTTLWVFLWQVLSPDHSCRDALMRFLAFLTARGLPPCSTDSGSYCEARKRLPEQLLSTLTRQTGEELQTAATPPGKRPVKVVDGSTVSMPDTARNAKAFGKPRNQHEHVGFPLARIVVLLCLATGAALELAIAPYRGKKTGELSLFREIQPMLKEHDILLGDRIFGTYCDIARLRQRGIDVVFRNHANRSTDFRRGIRLGREDHLVAWDKPTARPDWLTNEEFDALPATLTLRELRIRVNIRGFRVKSLIVITTLTNPDEYSKQDIGDLFQQRWQAELDLRSIKTVMQMDVLRCKSPEMVRKEMWVHLLAYNLLRSVLCSTAEEHRTEVRKLSFKAALQAVNWFLSMLLTEPLDKLGSTCDELINAVAQHTVGNRPNRFEPRKVKRGRKPYQRMKKTRAEERKQCL